MISRSRGRGRGRKRNSKKCHFLEQEQSGWDRGGRERMYREWMV